MARRVSDTIGQTVVIENRGGAGSIIGTDMVAKAEPDGYTLLLGQSGPISINPAVYKDLRYDPVKDFAPITMTTAYPYILAVNAKLPVKSLQDFVALGEEQAGRDELRDHRHRRRQPPGHRAVQQQGRAQDDPHPLSRDRAGGRRPDRRPGQHGVQRSGQRAAALQAGTLRGLAVTSAQRSPVAPELPTIAESGYPGFEALAWHGILAPAKTPPNVINKLHGEIVKALQHPETKDVLVKQAMQPVGNTPEEFAAFIKQDIAIWKAVATEADVSVK